MPKKTWTATSLAPWLDGECILRAQYRGGRADMLKRLRADDQCWGAVKLERGRMWDKKHFDRGLAIRAYPCTLEN